MLATFRVLVSTLAYFYFISYYFSLIFRRQTNKQRYHKKTVKVEKWLRWEKLKNKGQEQKARMGALQTKLENFW